MRVSSAPIGSETLNIAEQLLTGPGPRAGRTAIIAGCERLSYEAVTRRIGDRARQLIDAGVKAGDRVVVSCPNGVDFVVMWLAVQWIGAVSVALPPSYRRREIEYVVNHSGASAIVHDADLSVHLRAAQSGFTQSVRVISYQSEARAAAHPAPHAGAGSCPAAITYIAGAEGPLKGVVHTRAGILAAADAYGGGVLGLSPDDVCIGAIGLAWAFGLVSLLVLPFRTGAATVLLDSSSAGGLLAAIGESRATVLFGVPTTYRMLLRHPELDRSDLSSLRCCVSAAEPLPRWVAAEWCARTGVEILDGLGTSELTYIFISNRQGASRPGFIGAPVPGFEARVVDDAFQEVPRGSPGRLIVRGPTEARYWNDAEADRRAVRDGWTLTDDICVEHADRWFQHVRRSDALIVSAGYKISIPEVEGVLRDHPEVGGARVFSEEDRVRGQLVKAVVRPKGGWADGGLSARLQQYLKAEIAAFKCPRDIRVLIDG
jgi:2-aminobenzoate-CoA ligase